jgi:hypothetical protein
MVYIYESTTAVFFRSYCVICYKCEVYLGLLIQVKSDLLILYITIVSTINRLYLTKLNSLVLLAFTILKLKTYLIPNMVISNLKYLITDIALLTSSYIQITTDCSRRSSACAYVLIIVHSPICECFRETK